MRRYKTKRLEFANCNGVHVSLERCWATTEPEEDAYYLVHVTDVYDEFGGDQDPYDYDTETEARAAYEGFVEEYRNKPNWNAQATYDEAHGTINGEDAGIVQMRELWGG